MDFYGWGSPQHRQCHETHHRMVTSVHICHQLYRNQARYLALIQLCPELRKKKSVYFKHQ